MYLISDRVLALMKDDWKQEISLVSLNYSLSNADVVRGSVSIDRNILTGNRLEIGTATASELKFSLFEDAWGSKNFIGEEFFVKVRIDNVDIPMGYFTVDEAPEKNNGKISLSALDRMVKLDREISDLSSLFPSTLKNLVDTACSECGIVLSEPFTDTRMINEPPAVTVCMWRDIVRWAAGLIGKCAFMDWDGKLRFQWLVQTPTKITPSDRFQSKTEKPITTTGVQIVDVINYTSGSEDYPILLRDNLLIQSNFQNTANNLYAQLGSVTYLPYNCTTISYPHIWPLDIITYRLKDGTEVQSIVTHTVFKLNGRTTLEAVGESAEKVSYAPLPQGNTPALAEIRRKVSDQGAEIEMLAEWKSDANADIDDLVSSTATLQLAATAHGAELESIAEWRNDTDDAMASITQTANSQGAQISLVAESGTIKAAAIVAAINGQSTAQISANKISLTGKTINLTSDSIAISSTNFSVTPSGVATMKSGKIGDWSIGSYTYGGHTGSGLINYHSNGTIIGYFCPTGLNHYAGSFGGERTVFGVAPTADAVPTVAITTSGKLYCNDGKFAGNVQIDGNCIVNGTLTVGKLQTTTIAGKDTLSIPYINTSSILFGSGNAVIEGYPGTTSGADAYIKLNTTNEVLLSTGANGMTINLTDGLGYLEYGATGLYVYIKDSYGANKSLIFNSTGLWVNGSKIA